jgi:hypothetical protein
MEAQRDFWLAETDLVVAVVGGGVAGARSDAARPMGDSGGEGRH